MAFKRQVAELLKATNFLQNEGCYHLNLIKNKLKKMKEKNFLN
jgi:hypothetical protein